MEPLVRMNHALQYASRIVYGTTECLQLTYTLAQRVKDLPGCMIECGVAAGAQVIMLASACPEKTVYAFDSFQGICMPSNRDDQMPGIKMLTSWEQKALPDPGQHALVSSGATVVPEESFWDHIHNALGQDTNIKTVKGWFEHTVQDFKEPIALLRLDGDLYNSTFVCLLHLFPRLLDGAVLIVDDYQLKGCWDAVNEYFELISYQPDWIYDAGVIYLFK
jgi:hypothetical protein